MPKLKHLTAKEREKLLREAMLPSSDELGEEEKQNSSSSFQAESFSLPETGILEIRP